MCFEVFESYLKLCAISLIKFENVFKTYHLNYGILADSQKSSNHSFLFIIFSLAKNSIID